MLYDFMHDMDGSIPNCKGSLNYNTESCNWELYRKYRDGQKHLVRIINVEKI